MRPKVQYRQVSKENYNEFCKKYPDIGIEFLDWCSIIYTFNCSMRDYALETGEKVRFPFGFGEFCVSKKLPKKKITTKEGKEYINLPVNWQETKKKGKYIYHFNFNTEGFRFKWKWFLHSCTFFMHNMWVAKPSRVSSRLITHYLKREGQHFKYHEWDSLRINY